MTDRSKLLALAEAVEKLKGPDRMLDRDIAIEVIGWPEAALTGEPTPRYTASLDAAMTLVPEGWQCDCAKWWAEDGASVELIGSQWDGESWVHNFCDGRVRGDAFTPPLALCAAALRAQAA